MAPSNNLLRAYCADDAVEIRSASDGPDVMTGHFAVWDQWTTINSRFEGHFLEQLAPGAFDRSISERTPKVLFDHGKDPSVGNKPLGVPSLLEGDSIGMRYEVPLFDATYVNDLKPAIRSGAVGASFRFSVPDGGDAVEQPMRSTAWNPDRLPERTITNVDLYEFGPVTFPAYANATAGMRSMTDEFLETWMRDTGFVARLTERVGLQIVEKILAELPDGRAATTEPSTVDHIERAHAIARRHWLAEHNLLPSKDIK